ncbi:YdbH domain-containing protein [Marinobacter sp. 1_MG-2023]|uniref:YdbH domain-containing protein n=1 Tax=Marinobacter sp. 1_MG-2023 TaxID=3062627 RepID=UPI0026E1A6CC|nr:YdbH domain-containing protein [Marinobacter sp. 1_MG-2023]MDO6823549.1 YdbH domain-containing protein [Marinobacter sp. 1_MG-2023]
MRIAWKPIGWGIFAVLVLTILSGILAARHLLNETLQQNGIETLEWQGLRLSFSGVSVRELELVQSLPTRKLELKSRELNLGWRSPEWGEGWLPQLTALTAGYLELDWHTKPGEQSAGGQQEENQWPPEMPSWLPSEITVQQFRVTLPCEAGRCPLTGGLSITGPESGLVPVTASVHLDHDGHQVALLATLDGVWDTDLDLSAELAIDGTRYLSATSGYLKQGVNGLVSWRGSVAVPDLPQTDWLLAWLQTWQSIPADQWPEQPETGSMEASWELQGPGDENFLAYVTGSAKVQAQLPQPWPAPGVGTIGGNLEVALKANQGRWQPETLQADLVLSHPAAWIRTVPELMQPDSLTLSVRPAPALAPLSAILPTAPGEAPEAKMPLNVELNSRGGANVSLRSHLSVTTKAPWMMQLGETQLNAAMPELEVAGWRLTKPRVEIALTGQLDTNSGTLRFGESTFFEVDRLEPVSGSALASANESLLKGLRAELGKTTLNASYAIEKSQLDSLHLEGPVSVDAKEVRHPQLLPQSWQFNGRVESDLAHTDVAGVLGADAGATINLDLKFPYSGLLTLEGETRVSGKQEAEALSRIFSAWPSLLTVSGGTVSANATYKQPQAGPMLLDGRFVFTDWSGIYDRTAWSKMNGSAEFRLEEDNIKISVPELTVEEVNSGLPIGPLLLAGTYEAPLAQLAAGTLVLAQANTNALDGKVRIQPGRWNLAQAPVTIPVELTELSLAYLLQLYPTEGLAGTGILSGTVPVLFDPATGIRVESGRIAALEPGGRLQLTAERLKALASQNDSMKLVAQALEDFRYSVLDSGIDYDENGTLVLALHLKGNSPNVGEGQPVVLNINLEENIPALLRSLQLSGKVNDAVTERVKELFNKRE